MSFRSLKKNAQILSWVLFDFGNSAFPTVILTAFYVLYFKQVVMEGSPLGDFYWGLNVAISMLMVGLTAPVLGATADSSSFRRGFMVIFALLAIIFTGLLSTVSAGAVFLGSLFFIVANIGFEGSTIFNDSFLPQISTVENRGRISGWGWGIGYLGGILSLLLVLPLVKGGFKSENLSNVRMSFWVVSAQYLVFCLPAFILLKDLSVTRDRHSVKEHIRNGFGRALGTLREIKKYRDLFLLILAFFIYNDGICTTIVFASSFANDTLYFTIRENIIFLLSINIVSAIGAVSFGYIVDKIGAKKSIMITLTIWIIALFGAYFVTTKIAFYLIGILVGIALGSSQSATRTLVGLFSPKKRSAEFFGFSAIGGKFSAIIGPVLFGFISSTTGNQRNAVLVVILFFCVGFILMFKVNEKRGIKQAKKEDELGSC